MIFITNYSFSNPDRPARKQYRAILPTDLSNTGESVESKQMENPQFKYPKAYAELSAQFDWLRLVCIRKANEYPETRGEGDELFQRTVIKALKYLGTYQDQGKSIKPWLSTIMSNLAKDMRSAVGAERSKLKDNVKAFGGDDGDEIDIIENPVDEALMVDSAEAAYFAKVGRNRVLDAIDQIKDIYREPLRMSLLQGLKYSEIAKILNINEVTVGTRIHRGHEILREMLSEVAQEYGFQNKKKKK